ncbi:hypothetical protein ARAM_005278 [Aspergillus rambellii]|uniref:Uncharacterized protein n=1 Tax=Aspergillus rambellii TaxID=308745 RepID=A0A0F8UI88_9EURO|nr:hypothetical protein ARAM_005278 [Aspergillus rambellii]
MSPTFLQKEFITKGLTSFPLAVHIPNTLRPPCDCSETLVFHLNHLRQIVTSPAQFRFDQMLQGAQAALSGCRGFLQCARGHMNNSTSLLLCMSTLEVTLQLCDYWTSCELLPSSSGRAIHHHHHHHHHHGVVTVGYGEYEMGPEETRRVRRFLIRGRLLQCKETLGLLAEAAELNMAEGVEGSWNWLRQIIGGSEAMTDTFLQVLSEGCICN